MGAVEFTSCGCSRKQTGAIEGEKTEQPKGATDSVENSVLQSSSHMLDESLPGRSIAAN